MHVVGLTLSAVAGICFWSGLAVLFGGKQSGDMSR